MKKMKLNQKGFSLVELMVVVAIIGILATIGIPQYQKFMAKARQSEAKSHLNAIFQGEASYFTEYNAYTVSMKAIGAGAAGQNLRYGAGFGLLTTCSNPVPNMPPEFQAAAGDSNDFTDALVCVGSGATWSYWGACGAVPAANITGVTGACDATARTYTAYAWGNPTNTPGAAPNNANNNGDQFTINEQRLLTNTAIGM